MSTTPPTDNDLHDRPWFSLVYLLFLFLPLAYWNEFPRTALLVSVGAAALFVPMFLLYFRAGLRARVVCMLLTAGLGFAVMPFNPGGNTFVIFAIGMAAATLSARRAIIVALALLPPTALLLAWVMPKLAFAAAGTAVVAVIGGMVLAGTLYARERARRNAELRLTQDEVRRLAALAERERIGRDLHDLLGHTLSLVALKSELAGKLVARDPAAARAQIGEVEQVARQALAQVREAVSGIRCAGLDAELAAARLALLAADIRLEQRVAAAALDRAGETALSLALREAITNVLRHAGARRVEVELTMQAETLCLRVADDGRGGIDHPGNGLSGMRERIEACGGRLEIDSPAGGGTVLKAWMPRTPQAPVDVLGAAA